MTTALAGLAALLAGCNDLKAAVEGFTDKSVGYAQIETSLMGNGTHRAQLVTLMGTPVQVKAQSFAGLDGESMVFIDASSVYHFFLVNSRAVTKSQSPKPIQPSTK